MHKKFLYVGIAAMVIAGIGAIASREFSAYSIQSHTPVIAAFTANTPPSSMIAAASGVIPALQSSADAHDATRVSDLHTVQLALDLYLQACGSFPGGGGENPHCSAVTPADWATLATDIARVVPSIASLPNDPQAPTKTYAYSPTIDFTGYTLTATFEDQNNLTSDDHIGSPNAVSGTCGIAGLYCVMF